MLDQDGFIGKGVHTEVQDIINKRLPVYLIDYEGTHYPITALTGSAFLEGPDWATYTHISIPMLKREQEEHEIIASLQWKEEEKNRAQ